MYCKTVLTMSYNKSLRLLAKRLHGLTFVSIVKCVFIEVYYAFTYMELFPGIV